MKCFTVGKLRILNGVKPLQFALPRATTKLILNGICRDVHLQNWPVLFHGFPKFSSRIIEEPLQRDSAQF